MTDHISAIHVLKAKLKLTDDDYRALLKGLTAKSSSKQMSQAERRQVREHLQGLAERMGVAAPTSRRRPLSAEQFEKVKKAASPKERKVWALWHQLGKLGQVSDTSGRALNKWVERQVSVSALGFATSAQLDTLIESLKLWVERGHA